MGLTSQLKAKYFARNIFFFNIVLSSIKIGTETHINKKKKKNEINELFYFPKNLIGKEEWGLLC